MTDCLARFVFDKDRLKPGGRVRSFDPNSDDELSVFGISDMSCAQKVAIGDCVANLLGRSQVRGWECLCRSDFCDLGLRVEPADPECETPHFNVVDWPPEPDARLDLRLSLVQRAKLIRRNLVVREEVDSKRLQTS